MMKNYVFILLLFITNLLSGQSIKNYVDSCYSFNPHDLSEADITKKSALLDEFWNKVESNIDYYLPLLRIELKSNDHKPFFYFDGGSLLLKNSKTDEDYAILYNALKKVDLIDIQCADYLHRVSMFAKKGFDTYPFAEKILDSKEFKAFIVNHALTLDKDYSLLFVLLPVNTDYYLDKLIVRLKSEKAKDNQLAIINVLGYVGLCKADAVIDDYSLQNDLDKQVKERIKTFKNMKHKRQDDTRYKELVDKRNKMILSRLSDEALYELDDVTKKIKENYSCR